MEGMSIGNELSAFPHYANSPIDCKLHMWQNLKQFFEKNAC